MIWNLRDLELNSNPDLPEGHRFSAKSLTADAEAKLTGLGIYELAAGGGRHWPYHFELSEEEWLIVVEGEVVVRTPNGEQTLSAGDVACFPAGEGGAHTVRNDSDAPARFAMPSTQDRYGGGAIYPDSGKFGIYSRGWMHRGRLGDAVPYWEGEA